MGIRIGVDPSWFFVLFLYIWLLSSGYKDTFGPNQDNKAFALAVVSALLFFFSVVLHELGHAVVARRNGIAITSISLWMFGGMADLRSDPRTPGAEFRISAAGPAVTFLVIVAALAAGFALYGGDEFRDGLALQSKSNPAGGAVVLGWFANVNAFVLVVNLLPALPLDGGRILRAFIWWRTGDRNRATRVAARLGRGFAFVVAGLGLYVVVMGSLLGLWLVLIAWFISGAARAAETQSAITSRLEGLKVSDVMDAEPVAIAAAIKLDQAEDEFFLRYGYPWFPVIDQPGHVLGVLTKSKVDQVPEALRREYTADQVMISDPGSFKIDQEAPLETLLQAEGLAQLGAVMAVDREGILRGIVTADQVRRALRPEPA
ncbi:MAG TPA: site-2 protease family protein [Thermoleophilaceae bacterium]|jgi:Zn-dependent protease|nr:site-2 protease family protein [Thermoleophilaceae bacterium]